MDPPLQRLLEPAQLDALRRESADLLLIHVASAAGYAAGHIAGAVHVAPGELVCGIPPATGQLPPIERLEALFARIGYRPDAQIVAYDDEGGGWAGRFIWTLDVIGHRDWAYLDGGVHAWADAGLPLDRTAASPTPARARLSIDRAPIADAADILAVLGDPDTVVWDCRSAEEYSGRRITATRNGHIPGAVHLDWLELMDRSRALRLREDLRELLAARGITADKHVIAHCQTHHRSGLAYLAARLLEFPSVRGYHGSWSDWGNRDDTPVESGG